MRAQALQLLAAARQLLAKEVRLDLAWVEGLRKDFLTLMKNCPRVKDYKEADRLREAFKTFSGRFDALFFEHFLNNDMKYNLGMSEGDAKWYDKQLRSPAWDFYIELRLPMGYPAAAGDEFNYGSPEAKFEEFKQKYPTWKARVQRKARAFWKVMEDFIDYYERVHGQSGHGVQIPDVDNTELEGFKLTMRGFRPDDEHNQQELAVLKEGLRIYRRRAEAVFPLLLQKQIPVTVEFKPELDKGGTYNRGTRRITLYASSLLGDSKGPPWVAHVMAHEMGHHLFQTYLSKEAVDYWHATIQGDWGDLDIQELLDKWPGDTWAYDFPRVMGATDPILALQVDAASHDPDFQHLQSKEDFQKLLDSGTRTLVVPQTPITGYANKNPEEAFCEAIGLLVAYGPRALHERVRLWLETALPNDAKVTARVAMATTWYHLTDRAKFKLDAKFAPADNAIAIEDRSGRPGIYLGDNVERWVNGQGYWRPFVAEFKVDPSVKNDPGVHGRYGGEMFVPASSFSKLTLTRVIPLDAYARENYGEPGWIEGSLGVEFDTGNPIERNKRYPGYHYSGPDVRSMPTAEVSRLKKDLRKVKG